MKDKIYPPSTIGIFGGGQLGKMLAQEAKKMGYKVIVLDPDPDSVCGQVSDEQIVSEFSSKEQALVLANKSDILTYEFENIPADIIRYLEKKGFKVFPGSNVLEITQNRIKEKEFLKKINIKTAPFKGFSSISELRKSAVSLRFPAVLKTATGGYDGKGQVVLKTKKDINNIPDGLFTGELIYEEFVPFKKELSVICTRSRNGDVVTFPVPENIHRDNILYISKIPAEVSDDVKNIAFGIAEKIIRKLNAVGTIGIEMFLLQDNTVLVNEIAPRVHNSGHYSIEGCYTSQFNQHIRAICGLSLGSTKLVKKAAMVNILGDCGVSEDAKLSGIDKMLDIEGLYLHLYGKSRLKPKRKMGHITALGDTVGEAVDKILKAKSLLKWV